MHGAPKKSSGRVRSYVSGKDFDTIKAAIATEKDYQNSVGKLESMTKRFDLVTSQLTKAVARAGGFNSWYVERGFWEVVHGSSN
jgi:uncharacterized protein (DUF885 family)